MKLIKGLLAKIRNENSSYWVDKSACLYGLKLVENTVLLYCRKKRAIQKNNKKPTFYYGYITSKTHQILVSQPTFTCSKSHGMKMGLRSPLGPPSISGVQGPPFQHLNIIVCRRFEPPILQTTPLYGHLTFYIFSKPPNFGNTFPSILPQ